MTEQKPQTEKPAKVRPAAIKTPTDRPRGILKTDGIAQPRGVIGSIRAEGRSRPSALPVPMNRKVAAFTSPAIVEKWNADASGIRALAQGDNVITMFSMIGEDYWSEGGGVTARKVASQLRAIGGRDVEVHINSPGGDMFEGIAIYNVLREHPFKVTVKVMGMAASAASIIAMAGDDIQVGSASFIMIHNCWVLAAGNQNDFREIADFLAPFDAAMADVYVERTGQEAEDVAKWMNEETFMSGKLCVDRGFADSVLSADKLKVDEEEKAKAKTTTDLYAVEHSLISQGQSRAQARARIKALRGMPGAAGEDEEVMPSADLAKNEDFCAALRETLAIAQAAAA